MVSVHCCVRRREALCCGENWVEDVYCTLIVAKGFIHIRVVLIEFSLHQQHYNIL